MRIPEINIREYSYDLQNERIADFPLEDRSSSKLMVTNRDSGELKTKSFRELPQILTKNHHLVFNKTKVINARIFAKKGTGGAAEILLLNPTLPSPDPQISLSAEQNTTWKCMVGGKKIAVGTELKSLNGSLLATVISKEKNIAECKFDWEEGTFLDLINEIGKIPLPPYIERELIDSDNETYQTVYAKNSGSVAAPTAGLHFTEAILKEIERNGTSKSEITLHVGAGTFQPVKSDVISEHKMHSEILQVSRETVKDLLNKVIVGKKIVAVGTTSIRTLESLAVFGELLGANPGMTSFEVGQWSAYNVGIMPAKYSLKNVLNWMEINNKSEIFGGTELIIVPGYKFRIVENIITNFHQPESTLILLVAAFLGKELWEKSYNYALKNDYRFLSYGDSSILL